jgi:hypothetical protein
MIGIVRNIVEEHQAGTHRILEIQNAQAGRSLIEPVTIAARIEAQQAADQQP